MSLFPWRWKWQTQAFPLPLICCVLSPPKHCPCDIAHLLPLILLFTSLTSVSLPFITFCSLLVLIFLWFWSFMLEVSFSLHHKQKANKKKNPQTKQFLIYLLFSFIKNTNSYEEIIQRVNLTKFTKVTVWNNLLRCLNSSILSTGFNSKIQTRPFRWKIAILGYFMLWSVPEAWTLLFLQSLKHLISAVNFHESG